MHEYNYILLSPIATIFCNPVPCNLLKYYSEVIVINEYNYILLSLFATMFCNSVTVYCATVVCIYCFVFTSYYPALLLSIKIILLLTHHLHAIMTQLDSPFRLQFYVIILPFYVAVFVTSAPFYVAAFVTSAPISVTCNPNGPVTGT